MEGVGVLFSGGSVDFVMLIIGAVCLTAVIFFLCVLFSPASARPRPTNPNITKMTVPANGLEKFTPVLLPERVYRLEISGTYRFRWGGLFFGGEADADARYYTDAQENFVLTKKYKGIRLNGVSASTLASWTEDRADNCYSCMLDGAGERIPVQLSPPEGRYERHPEKGAHLILSIELQPAGTVTSKARREAAATARAEAQRLQEQEERQRLEALAATRTAAEVARAAAKSAQERAQQAEALQKKQDEEQQAILLAGQLNRKWIEARVYSLSVMVHHNSNFLDSQFCEQFVRKHLKEILKSKEGWSSEYSELMAYPDLVTALQLQAPQVLQWYERRVDMISMAERLTIMPPESPITLTDRRITARTIAQVEAAISEFFQLRNQVDQLRADQAQHGYDSTRYLAIEENIRGMAFRQELLEAYGITAQTPEAAEEKFLELCPYPGPTPTLYEELAENIRAGANISPDDVKSRLEDLFREEIILKSKRRLAVRVGGDRQRESIDARLSDVRREATTLRDFFVSRGCSVEFPDYREREREDSTVEKLRKELENQKQMRGLLKGENNANEEVVEERFAERLAKILGDGTETDNYT